MAKKKFNPFVLLYVISGILLIISIAPIADTARDIYSTKGRYSGYEEESLFNDFMEKDYSGLVKKINYNKGITCDLTKVPTTDISNNFFIN